MGIVNVKFKDGVSCPIVIHQIKKAVEDTNKKPGTTFGSRKVDICPHTGKEVVMEYIGINNGHEEWLCLHNDIPEDDAVDVAAFKKRHNIT